MIKKRQTSTEAIVSEVETTASNINDLEVVSPVVVENKPSYILLPQVKRLEINGVVYSRELILMNEELMTTLIVGNSPFVKKI